MALDIPLPTASPQDDPEQYIPLLLSAIEGFLLARDIWEEADYPQAYSYMQELMEYVVEFMETAIVASPVGATMIWHTDTPPDRWLICDGTGVLKADYPKLYALWGGKYGESLDFFGLPDLRSRLPYGADFVIELDANAGEADHTLTIAELPAHNHIPSNGGNFLVNGGTGSKNHQPFAGSVGLAIAATNSIGGDTAHNNIPPVLGVNFIVFAGI